MREFTAAHSSQYKKAVVKRLKQMQNDYVVWICKCLKLNNACSLFQANLIKLYSI